MNIIAKPKPTEYPAYFDAYIQSIKSADILKELRHQVMRMQAFLSEIPEDKEDFSYAAGKWTLKEVIGHIIDTERIMAYRALRFARGDKQELPGFDELLYVRTADFNKRTLYELAHEFGSVREANIYLFKSFDEAALDRSGSADGKTISVRSLIYVIAGHTLHHQNVIKQKYLVLAE